MDNLSYYERFRQAPENAKKRIKGGRLKGMTDINPMWRIKCLTELFGPCGVGWWTENERYNVEDGANGEKALHCELDLRFIVPETGQESKPVHGSGGAMLIAKESSGLRLDDEAWKKARTDAISVSCKELGIGADVYWSADSTKYTDGERVEQEYICDRCGGKVIPTTSKDGKQITPAQLVQFSQKRYNGGTYCAECQKALDRARKEREEAMKVQNATAV